MQRSSEAVVRVRLSAARAVGFCRVLAADPGQLHSRGEAVKLNKLASEVISAYQFLQTARDRPGGRYARPDKCR